MSMLPFFMDLEEPYRTIERGLFSTDINYDARLPWDKILIQPLDQLSEQIRQLALKRVGPIDDEENFKVSIDVQHFSPEEISVKVIEGQVIVEGNHEEKQDQHGYVSRRFVRRYALPKGCLPDTVESKLSSDGILTICAPKVLPLPSTGERIVPIIQTGPVKKRLSSSQPQLKEAPAKGNN